jgi:hypothetical protein
MCVTLCCAWASASCCHDIFALFDTLNTFSSYMEGMGRHLTRHQRTVFVKEEEEKENMMKIFWIIFKN